MASLSKEIRSTSSDDGAADVRTVEAVFLDIDGTLVDSNEFHVLAWQEAFDLGGYRIDPVRIRSEIGKGGDNLIPALIDGVSVDVQTALEKKHGQLFSSRYLQNVAAFPGAAELIKMLHTRRIKVVMASSASRSDVDHYVALLGVEELLAGTVCTDDVTRSKPAGDIFATALKKVHPINASRTRAIGDTPYDVIAAAKCQIGTIAVLSGGFPEHELRTAGALAVYPDVTSLLLDSKTAFG